MTNSDADNAHKGLPHAQIDSTQVPPVPDNFVVPGESSGLQDGQARYKEVQFHGNFGVLCGQYQEFTRYNITESQVRQIGWAAFGTCGWTAERS